VKLTQSELLEDKLATNGPFEKVSFKNFMIIQEADYSKSFTKLLIMIQLLDVPYI